MSLESSNQNLVIPSNKVTTGNTIPYKIFPEVSRSGKIRRKGNQVLNKIQKEYDDIDIKDGFKLREDWVNINNYKVNELALCKENSAVFALNNNPIHLTDYKIIEDELWLKGHSLMNRYFEKDKMVFKDDYLIIKKE